jgi:hypothetical protein
MREGVPHRMTPEERQRLRDQIYESNRGLRGGGRPDDRGTGGRGR